MRIQCAWCGKFLGEKEPLQDLRITSTICPQCFNRLKERVRRLRRSEEKLSYPPPSPPPEGQDIPGNY